jgi:O-antigen ligase
MNYSKRIFWWLTLAFFGTLPLHLRLNNSVFILLVVFWLLAGHWRNLLSFFKKHPLSWLLLALFAVNVLGLFNSQDLDRAWFNLDKKLQLLLFPIILGPALMERDVKKPILVLAGSSSLVLLYCLSASGIQFLQDGDSAIFFYHNLSNQLGLSAVYLSLYLALSVAFLLEDRTNGSSMPWWKYSWIALLVLGIFLLSSKSIFLFLVLYLLYYLLRSWRVSWRIKLTTLSLGGIALLAVLSLSPLGERFRDVIDTRLELANADSFRYDTDFDGLSMRLTFWRIAFEILDEQKAWILGVGPGDSQSALTVKYMEKGIYTGNPNFGDVGYRNHNTHNQYVETSLKSGLIGLLTLLATILLPALLSIPRKQKLLFVFQLLFAWLMLSEAVFERQKGLSLYASTFVVLLISSDKVRSSRED